MGIIQDALTGFAAEVRKIAGINRLMVKATQESAYLTAALNQNSYVAYFIVPNTSLSATEVGIAYIKNNDRSGEGGQGRNLIITAYDAFYGVSASGTGNAFLNLYKNPSGGTLVSTANPAVVSNIKFDSSNTPDIEAYVGDGTALTLTPGPAIPLPTPVSVGRDIFQTTTVVPLGSSIGFTWTTPAGNTAQFLTFLVSFYMES